QGHQRVAVTSGASTPEVLVGRVLDRLRALGAETVWEMPGESETTTFRVPLAEIQSAQPQGND
ncbi:MAG: hypothetical protein ABEJ96_05355, partial [Thiohalorhabdaceae bacterium]